MILSSNLQQNNSQSFSSRPLRYVTRFKIDSIGIMRVALIIPLNSIEWPFISIIGHKINPTFLKECDEEGAKMGLVDLPMERDML